MLSADGLIGAALIGGHGSTDRHLFFHAPAMADRLRAVAAHIAAAG